jgi:guanylate kinase
MLKIITLTGPTCSGKTTLENHLCKEHGWHKVVSHTSRQPRANEVAGEAYHFVDEHYFDMNRRDFIEFLRFDKNYYGVHKSSLPKDGIAVIVCEPWGADQIYEWCRRNNVPHIAFMLDVPLSTRLTFFMLRSQQETASGASALDIARKQASRLEVMMTTEANWVKDAAHYMIRIDDKRDQATQIIRLISDGVL